MMHLFVVSDADFVYLKRATEMTAGNLSAHLTKLEDAGFVKITKSFEGKKPKTTCKLTVKGRKDFQDYRENILKVLGE
jgi:DNA-binding MarR family transcriptional regulator